MFFSRRKKREALTAACRMTGQRFVIEPAEQEFFESFKLPLPVLAPEERLRRLLAFQGERRFFWRTCEVSQRRIYSAYPATAPFPVWSRSLWRDGNWDPLGYGQVLDLDRPVLEQVAEIWTRVPRPSRNCDRLTEVPVVEGSRLVLDSFLVFEAFRSKHCHYSVRLEDCQQCFDCYGLKRSTGCYECINCADCENLLWSEHCQGCSDSRFLAYCRDCKNCLFCANLEGREYCVFNEQVSPEEYALLLKKWSTDAQPLLEQARDEFAEFLGRFPVPHLHSDAPLGLSGNFLYRSKDLHDCFECHDSRELWHCQGVGAGTHCLEVHRAWGQVRQAAGCVAVGEGAEQLLNCVECWNQVSDLAYCSHCEKSRHLFGCVGLVDREYCIFNRQYTKGEYRRLRREVEESMRAAGTWGQFPLVASSGYAYNQSLAGEAMPLSRVQAEMMGYRWDEAEDEFRPSLLLGGREVDPAERFGEIPDRLDELQPGAVQGVLYICELSGRPFTLSREEVEFYLRHRIAPPKRGFEQRHRERVQRLGPRRLVRRKSSLSDEELLTAYPANWKRKVCSYDEWRTMVEKYSSR